MSPLAEIPPPSPSLLSLAPPSLPLLLQGREPGLVGEARVLEASRNWLEPQLIHYQENDLGETILPFLTSASPPENLVTSSLGLSTCWSPFLQRRVPQIQPRPN